MLKGKKKSVFVILDGASDRPTKELQNRTPFQIAFKPNLDKFAEEGRCGMHYPIKKGFAPESDAAVMALLGYDPDKYATGRGPLEAYGAEVSFKRGDLALRANFATLKGKKKLVDRRVGRTLTSAESEILARAINKKVKLGFPFIFKNTIEHRGVLVVKGHFSDNVTNVDPGYRKRGKYTSAVKAKQEVQIAKALDDDEVTQLTANLINNFVEQSNKVLRKHPLNLSRIRNGLMPANIVITRNAGIELPHFPKRSKKWLAFSSMPLEIAIAKLSGMDVSKFHYPEMISANVYKNLYYSLKNYLQFVKKKMVENWNKYDAFYIHVKETDVPGHDGQPVHKKKMIEMIDEILFSFLAKRNINLCVTSDHSTPCDMKMHSGDAIPFLVYGKGADKVKLFDEKSCAKGSFGKRYAKEVLRLAF